MIRHGQSTANATGVWQGQSDFPLSDAGRRQAEYTGRYLRNAAITGIYTSPLSRAYETAQIVGREAGFEGEVIPLRGLMERHGGMLEGYTWEEQKTCNPELVEKFLGIPEEERWVLVGAETDEEVLARFGEALSEIVARHRTGGRVAVISHGGAMRAFLRKLFGEDTLPDSERAPNASITRIAWETKRDRPRLLELASTKHLPGDSKTLPSGE